MAILSGIILLIIGWFVFVAVTIGSVATGGIYL